MRDRDLRNLFSIAAVAAVLVSLLLSRDGDLSAALRGLVLAVLAVAFSGKEQE